MVQLIAFIIFVASVSGIAFIIYRKIPVLVQLPQNGYNGLKKPAMVVKFEKKIKDFYFHFFKKQMLWHKILSFVKIWTLKIETKIDNLLHGVRKKAQELDKKNRKK